MHDLYDDYRNIGLKANAAIQSEQWYTNIYTRVFVELAANRFAWDGLPPEIDVRYMELTILRNALSVFYWEPAYGKFMARQGSPSGMRNMMDEPVAFTMAARVPNPLAKRQVRRGECVPVWGNYLQQPDTDIILMFAKRLAEIDRTLEINTKQARRPRLLIGNKNQRQTLANINRQIDEGVAAIGINQTIDMANQVTSVDLGVNPDNIEKLHIARGRIWNQVMSLLGINNANQDKKERMVSDEVAANDEQVLAMKMVSLNARRRAAEEMNALYDGSPENALITGYQGDPLEVSVRFSTDPSPEEEAKLEQQRQQENAAFGGDETDNENETEGDDDARA